MLGRRKLFQRKDDGLSVSNTHDLKQIFQNQNELVALNESVADSKQALHKGRGAVGRALLGTTEEKDNDSSALDLLAAGRQGLLQQITATTDVTRMMSLDPGAARFLADQLHLQLVALTSSVPRDRLAAKSLEIQIQTALRTYASSIQRLLMPLIFR